MLTEELINKNEPLESSKEIALKLTGVSKKYTIGKEKDGSLRGTLASVFAKNSSNNEEFWALKNVSFEVQKGDVVGIIGKNGAGKSTLLKILSQITKPTEGRIEINGRVASLLEVGTGFHPELTGRENIYLNGTILGMTRKEVASKFDEIVAFSGIEKFIDTPVKHYSSGMYVRLAFAVAAHLEPEILIIDEVLAVGDAEFQKKCLGKMKDVAGEGRTVLFVSHDLAAVRQLCSKSVLINKGKVDFYGYTEEAIDLYNTVVCQETKLSYNLSDYSKRKLGNHFVTFKQVTLNKTTYLPKDDLLITCSFQINNPETEKDKIQLCAYIVDQFNNTIYHINSMHLGYEKTFQETLNLTIKIPQIALTPGTYTLNLHLLSQLMHFDYVENEMPLIVEQGSIFQNEAVFRGEIYKEFELIENL